MNWTRSGFCCVLLALGLAAPAEPESVLPDRLPVPAVVVLKSGQVLPGGLRVMGDDYEITQNDATRIVVPRSDVDLTAPTLRDAYQAQWLRLAPEDMAAHLRLARWCVQVNSPDAAGVQLDYIARQIPADLPPDTRTAYLEQIRGLRQQIALSSDDHEWAPNEAFAVASIPEVTTSDTELTLASAVVPVSRGNETMEVMVPTAVQQEFTRSLQPLLLRRCAGVGCHGVTSEQQFVLRQPVGRALAPPQLSAANLQAVLQQVPGRPWESPLWHYAATAHSGSKPLTESELAQVVQPWLQQLVPPPSATPRSMRNSADGVPVTSNGSARSSPEPGHDPFDPAKFNHGSN